jgi:hypothetical protein
VQSLVPHENSDLLDATLAPPKFAGVGAFFVMDGDNDIRSFVVRARPSKKADSTDPTGLFLGGVPGQYRPKPPGE